ncbi:MAG: hypothetical protein ACREU5_11295 [Burkholderiales bacterium]
MPKPSTLTPHDRRRIAVSAGCDPSCVVRYIAGQPVRSTTSERIEKAIRNLNLDEVIARAAPAVAR